VKLLLDENLSDKILPAIADFFPESTHVKAVRLTQCSDHEVAEWAGRNDFTIVSKDTDFYQRSVVFGAPPKFIWLRVGNCSTALIVEALRSHHALINEFITSATESVLVLERR
jgi:predicted nuclease of predicted toxin-antitoxin system